MVAISAASLLMLLLAIKFAILSFPSQLEAFAMEMLPSEYDSNETKRAFKWKGFLVIYNFCKSTSEKHSAVK